MRWHRSVRAQAARQHRGYRGTPLGLLAALALLASAGLAAQSEPERGPIELEADRAEFDNIAGKSVYTGNVVLTRATMRVTGERMEVFMDENRRLQRVVVTGEPATYRDVPPGGGDPIDAQAPRMEYYVSGPERMVLLEGAVVERGRNRFAGERIVYRPGEDRIEAESAGGDDRIRIRLYPDEGDG